MEDYSKDQSSKLGPAVSGLRESEQATPPHPTHPLCPAAQISGTGAVLRDICIPHLESFCVGDRLLLPTCLLMQLFTHLYPHGLTTVYFTLGVTS